VKAASIVSATFALADSQSEFHRRRTQQFQRIRERPSSAGIRPETQGDGSLMNRREIQVVPSRDGEIRLKRMRL